MIENSLIEYEKKLQFYATHKHTKIQKGGVKMKEKQYIKKLIDLFDKISIDKKVNKPLTSYKEYDNIGYTVRQLKKMDAQIIKDIKSKGKNPNVPNVMDELGYAYDYHKDKALLQFKKICLEIADESNYIDLQEFNKIKRRHSNLFYFSMNRKSDVDIINSLGYKVKDKETQYIDKLKKVLKTISYDNMKIASPIAGYKEYSTITSYVRILKNIDAEIIKTIEAKGVNATCITIIKELGYHITKN